MVPAKDFKKRMVVEIDGAPHMIEQINVQTPSARGAATFNTRPQYSAILGSIHSAQLSLSSRWARVLAWGGLEAVFAFGLAAMSVVQKPFIYFQF